MAETTKGVFQRLVGTFSLSIRLGVVSRCETDRGPNSLTESLPHFRSELGTTVRYNVSRDAMQSNYMLGEEVCHLRS